MTGPQTHYDEQYGVNSPVAQAEWDTFLQRRKQLLDEMMNTAHMTAQTVGLTPPVQPQVQQPLVQPTGAPLRPAARDELIARARAWNIPNPESMDPAELDHKLQQLRAEIPRDEQTSLGSVGTAFAGAASEAASATARLLGNVLGLASKLPFADPSMSAIASVEKAKNFMWNLSMKAQTANELAGMLQPKQDIGAYQFLTGAGTVAGYALPAIAAWKAVGALGGFAPISNYARFASPMVRAAVQGGLSSALITGGSDETGSAKAIDIGLGAVLGGFQGIGGKAALASGLGIMGAGVGGSMGNTPEERQRNALIGGVSAAALPLVAPLLAQAFMKVTGDIKTPFEAKFNQAEQLGRAKIAQDAQLGRGPMQQTTARMAEEPGYPAGPDYEVHPTQPTLPVRAEPVNPSDVMQLPGMTEAMNTAQPPVTPTLPERPAPVRGLLQSPARSEMQGDLEAVLGTRTRFQNVVNDPTTSPEALATFSDRVNDTNVAISELRGKMYGLPPAPEVPVQLQGTKVVDRMTNLPKIVYHGTGAEYDMPTVSFNPNDGEHLLFGPGYYTTEAPGIADGYAGDMKFKAAWADGVFPTADVMQEMYLHTQRLLNEGKITGDAASGAMRALEDSIQSYQTSGYGSFHPDDLSYYGINPSLYPQLTATPERMPNVRMMRLDIKNPFDIDKEYNTPEVHQLIDQLEQANPGYNWNQARTDVTNELEGDMHSQGWMDDTGGNSGEPTIRGEQLYFHLNMMNTAEPVQGVMDESSSQNMSFDPMGTKPSAGRTGTNLILKNAGFDGITHVGGARTGNNPHQVWIAFDPSQIHSPWDVEPMTREEALAQAHQMTKQSSIMESGDLPDHLGKMQITDADVAQAQVAANPAGPTIIKGMNLSETTLNQLYKEHEGIVFIERDNGQLDAFIFPKEAVPTGLKFDETPVQLIDEYEEFGIFTGQHVVTSKGVEGVVLKPSSGAKGLVVIQSAAGGAPKRIARKNVMPSRYGAPLLEVPQMYNSFKADVLRYMNENAAEAQMAPIQGMTDERVAGVLAERMNNYFDVHGINDPAVRQVLEQQFNSNWVDEFKALDPEAKALQESMQDWQAVEATAAADSPNDVTASLEEKAPSRGFVWVSNPGDGGTLRDTVNPEGALELPMETDQAAHEFLDNVDRELPDLTPASSMPADVAGAAPENSMLEPVLLPEEHGESLGNSLEILSNDTNLPAGGGSGGGGAQPPVGGAHDFGGQPRLPKGSETLGGQLERLRKSDPGRLWRMTDQFQGLLASKMRYTRYGMLNLEKLLFKNGVDLGKAWEHFEALSTGRTKAANEGHPWLEEWADITRNFPRKLLRDGTVTRLHEIEDPNARAAAIYRLKDTHGLSQERINQYFEGDGKITDFMHRWFEYLTGDPAYAVTAEREIFRYMPHVRARQAAGVKDPWDVGNLSPEVQFFGEHLRDGQVQLRVMDARELGNYMVRSAMFKKHEADAWHQLVTAWQDPRIPQPLQDYMLDYANLSRYGYNARGELGVRAIKTLMSNVLKTPVTTAEAQHMLNMPSGGMYMSLLAGRTSIFFRDAIQPLMALAKIEMPHMASVYRDVLKGKNANSLRAMYDRGLKAGWIEKENPNLEAGGIFEEQPDLRENELLGISPEEAQRREVLAQVGDKFFGLPNWLVRPTASNLSTLKWYGRQGQLHRLIVGESGYRQAITKIGAFRKSILEAALTRDPSKAMSYDKLADDAFFTSFEPPIQRKLSELVAAGSDEEAAQLFGREVANWSQFRYGRRELPPALRGEAGRWLFNLSNFSGQFIEGMNSMLRNGTVRQRARGAMVIGAITAGLNALQDKTGWGFSNWAWTQAIQYTGGPLLERTMRNIEAATGFSASSADHPISQTQRSAMQEATQGGLLPSVHDFNPWVGYVGSMAEYSAAAQGTNPIEQMARFAVTGDRGSRVDFQRELEARLKAEQDSAAANLGGVHSFPQGSLSPNGGTMNQQQRSVPYTPNTFPGSGAQQ